MNRKIIKFLKEWITKVYSTSESWKANYYYLDEIYLFNKLPMIDRKFWIKDSIEIKELLNLLDDDKRLLNFISVTLEFTKKRDLPTEFSMTWLKKNISKISPPTFSFTTLEYFKEKYESDYKELYLSKNEISNINSKYRFFYNEIYDETDKYYYRWLLIF